MNSQYKASTLSAFALGLIGLCFVLLLNEVFVTRQQWQEIPRIFGGLFAPIPLAVFLAYCLAYKSGEPKPPSSDRLMMIALVGSILFTIVAGFLLQGRESGKIGWESGPAIAESSVFTASVLNFFFLRSPFVAAALSGISIGLTVFVIFLT